MWFSVSGHSRIATPRQAGGGERVLAGLLAEAFVAVEHTLGVGTDADDQALGELSRAVWLELVRRCPDDVERARVIRRARQPLAPAGAAACRPAATMLLRIAGGLLHAAGDCGVDERQGLASCADRCALGAARLERIVLERCASGGHSDEGSEGR